MQVLLRRLFLTVTLIALTSPAAAQYFGRNKVQWENFDFKVLQTAHFDIYYYEEERQAAEDVARMAERWYDRLSRLFGHEFNRKPIVLYANHPDFQQTTTTGGLIGEGTGGFTDAFKNRIVMPLTESYAETDHVLGHEMVHVFQYDMAGAEGNRQNRYRLEMMPLWMVEGLAEYFSQGRVDPQTAMWMRDATLHDRLPTLRDLMRDPRFSPYQYGQAFWAYVGGRYGDEQVTRLFIGAGTYGIEEGFRRVLGRGANEVIQEWHESTRAHFSPIAGARQTPSALGTAFLGRDRTRGDVNIAPSVSPDGRSVAFLSTRELFSIDLFVADVASGNIQRVVSTAGNPHFDALRFIDSAGGWSPDSRKLAVAVFERGDNRLAIVDVASRRVERRIAVPGVEALSNPVWSPDGRSVAFSGQVGGISDLFVYDLESRAVNRLTNDRYADIQPAFSPDGRSIAFVTDRGEGTDFDTLSYHAYRIAVIDLQSREVRTLRLFENAKNINPQYSADGRSLYFIAAPEGVSDIFRYSFADGNIVPLTRVSTGVTGITEISPALSVSSRSDVAMFSVFENSRWNIYRLEPPSAAATAVASASDAPRAAVLPPASEAAVTGTVAQILDDPTQGLLPEDPELPIRDYRPRLSLDYLGPPVIGVATDSTGYGVGGSISAYFSDVLGQHQLGVGIQGGGGSSSYASDLGAEVFYLNQQRRINWGTSASHIPYVSGFTTTYSEVVNVNGTPTLVDVVDQYRDTITVDEVYLLSHYPFSRTRRAELNVGYTRVGFDSEIERYFILGNSVLDSERFDIEAPESVTYQRGALAFVGDSSNFGFVSPVRGTRYRFEGGVTTGDFEYQTALADYRRYFFARPVTFAVRGLHFGRYGGDAEVERPLTIARDTLVRGYDGIDATECTRSSSSEVCPEYNRLIGSRIGVVNVELRVPLFGTDEYGLIEFQSLPTEIAAFVDAGTAWREGDTPELRFEEDTAERVPVISAGIALRILLGGYIPIQLYAAKPFQRPQEDVVFGFTIAPGW